MHRSRFAWHLEASGARVMDAQHIIDALISLAGVVGGFVMNELWSAMKKMREDMATLNQAIARDYVRRDDYRDDIGEIKGMLVRIFDKLDEKQDKS
jgi:hypothetical protein